MKLSKCILTIGTIMTTSFAVIPVYACSTTNTDPTKTNPTNIDPIIKPIDSKTNMLFYNAQRDQIVNKNKMQEAFNKFSKNINFNPTGIGAYGKIGAISQNLNFNKDKKYIKIMVVGTPVNKGYSEVLYYCGIMGFVKEPNSNDETLKCSFKDFENVNEIGDESTVGSVKSISLQPKKSLDGLGWNIFDAIGIPPIAGIVQFLLDTAKVEFPQTLTTLKPLN